MLHERVGLRVAHLPDRRDQVAHAVAAHRVAELALRRDLVSLGDRDVAHVVAEAGELEPARLGPAAGRAHPGADPVVHFFVCEVAHDHLAALPQPRAGGPELAVAVGGLVQVHEVHVDRAPRQVAIALRVQVQVGLLQRREAGDPHLRGREGVHPEHEADASLRLVRLGHHARDLVGGLHDRLAHDAAGDPGRGVEGRRDALGVLGDLPQRLGAVQVLAAGHEPDLALFQAGDHLRTSLLASHAKHMRGVVDSRPRGQGLFQRSGEPSVL